MGLYPAGQCRLARSRSFPAGPGFGTPPWTHPASGISEIVAAGFFELLDWWQSLALWSLYRRDPGRSDHAVARAGVRAHRGTRARAGASWRHFTEAP